MPNPYGYYILLRWISCPSFVYLALLSYERQAVPWVWIFGVLAGIYNPIFTTHLGREIWLVVNVASILLVIIHSILSKQIQNAPIGNANKYQVLQKGQAFFSKLSKISVWYRVLIASSIVWIVGVIINTNPWTTQTIHRSSRVTRRVIKRVRQSRSDSGGDLSGTVNNWDEFFLYAVLPIVLFWGILWIVKGFWKNRKVSEHIQEKKILLKRVFKINILSLKEGLRRVIVILALIASCVYGINGFYFAETQFKPKIQETFSSFKWDDISREHYYEIAKNYVQENKTKNSAFSGISLNGNILSLDMFDPKIKPKNLPNFLKKPPQYNELIFKEAFSDSLQAHIYLKFVSAMVFGIIAFVLTYGALNYILFATFWVINGFLKKDQEF